MRIAEPLTTAMEQRREAFRSVRARLSARDPGDGVRRPQPRLCFLQRNLHARHLRQYEDGGRNRVRRQRPSSTAAFGGCGHHLVEPTPCTPASGWERARSRTRSGSARALLHARLRVASYEELNAWLLARCVAYATAHKHPELTNRTIWQVIDAERPRLVQIAGPFDGFHATQTSVPKTCLVRFRQQQILGRLARRRRAGRDPGLCRSRRDPPGWRNVGEHFRRFGRGATIYDSWHYVPVLARKPGALRDEPLAAPLQYGPTSAHIAPLRHSHEIC